MNENLQLEIEDYVSGKMKPDDKKVLEEKAISDENIRKEIEDLTKLREILIRQNARKAILEARKSVNSKPKNGLVYFVGTFAAAASFVLFLLSTPIRFAEKEFNYRGDGISQNTETQTRENDFEKARKLINNQENTTEAITILENLQNNENVGRHFQNDSKWMLVIAYLQTNQVEKAEKKFSEINCEDIDCPFSTWEKAKIKWKIFWGKIF